MRTLFVNSDAGRHSKAPACAFCCTIPVSSRNPYISVVPHSAYFGPGLLASIHCIAAMPREALVERYDCDFAVNPLHDAILPCEGRIAVPQGPGLGVEPDAAVIEQLRLR
jgi:L-alanine-DL-glutamate epimerase-like enolase superfamily enzyme